MKVLQARSLRANFSWTLLGRVVFSFAQWGLLALLARLGTPEVVGEYTLGLAVTAPIFVLTGLNLRAVLATDSRVSADFSQYLATRLVTTVLAFALVWLVTALVGYGPAVTDVILLVAAMKGAEAVQDIVYGRFQQAERMDFIAKSRFIRGPLLLLTAGATFFLTGSLPLTVVGLTLATLLVLICYDLPALRRAVPQTAGAREGLDRKAVLRLVRIALPLGVSMMLVSLSISAPQFIIERQMGEFSLGLFAALSYLAVAGNTIMSSLGQAASPRLAKLYAGGQRRQFSATLKRLLLVAAGVGVSGLAVGVVAGGPLLGLVYGPEYAREADLLLWVLAYAGVTYISTSLGVTLTSTRQFRIQLPVNIGMVGIVILLCLLLIPTYGLTGAVMAQGVAQLAKASVFAVLVSRALRQSTRHQHELSYV